MLASILLLGSLSAASPVPPTTPTAPPAPLQSEQQREFMDQFRQAMKINAKEEMSRLVRTRQEDAINSINLICKAIAEAPRDEHENEIAALRVAWKAAFKTDFVDHQYEFFSLLRREFHVQRRKFVAQYELNLKEYNKTLANKEMVALTGIGMKFQGFGSGFSEIGDKYYAAQAYLMYALCFDETNRGKDADLKRACEGYEQSLAYRKEIGLLDRFYNETKVRYDSLVALGYGNPAESSEAKARARESKPEPTPQPAEAAASTALRPTFEVYDDLTKLQRPTFSSDLIYPTWNAVALGAKDSTAKFAAMRDGPTVIRAGVSKATIDLDRDGVGDVDIPMTGNITPVELTLGSGAEERRWAFLAVIGQSRDTYQGFQFNLEPTDDFMSIYIAPAGSMAATVGETPVRIFDDNMDGIYGSPPLEWAYTGVIEDSFQRDMDSIHVGSEKSARPWSRLQEIGDTWYEVETDHAGTALKATPMQGVETGTLKLALKGVSADYLVVRGTDSLQDCYFDLAPGGKGGTTVPAGRYELYMGQVSKGKRNQKMKALVLPIRNTQTWDVPAGGDATVELGAPFKFDFSFSQDDESVTVEGFSIVTTGKSRESYQRLWNCTVQPEVQWRKAGGKRGTKESKMTGAVTQDEITDHGGDFRVVWFPFDYTFKKKKAGETVEVMLFEKKNKLFGKIESDWAE